MNNFYYYKQKLTITYLEVDRQHDTPILYTDFEMIEENILDIYSEIAAWETSGYCSNYLMAVI